MTKGELWQQLRELLTPPARERFSELVDRLRFEITSSVSEYSGPLNIGLLPYAAEIIDLAGDKKVSEIVMCFGTQTGKSTIIQLIRAAWVYVRKQSVLNLMPSAQMAERFSRTRWIPFCKSSKEFVAACCPLTKDGSVNDKLVTGYMQRFIPCNVLWKGAGADVIGDACALVIIDELDAIKAADNDPKADKTDQALNRSKSFAYPLHLLTSTPTTPDGPIWQRYLAGSQHVREVACLKCGHWQQIETERIRWAPGAKKPDGTWDYGRVKAAAAYECAECKHLTHDGDRHKLLATGRWRRTNDDAEPGVYSFHLPSVYAPWPSCSFGSTAVRFLKSKASLAGLKDFTQNYEAKPFSQDEDSVISPVPLGDYVLSKEKIEDEEARFLCVDVQGKGGLHFFATVRAWTLDGRHKLRWHGRLETFEEIDYIANEYGVTPPCVALDSRYSVIRGQVTEKAAEYGWTLLEAHDKPFFLERLNKKRTFRAPATLKPIPVDAGLGKRNQSRPLARLYKWSNPAVFDLLLLMQQGGKWDAAKDVGPQYKIQMAGQKKVRRLSRKTGKLETVWVDHGSHGDHYLSTERMQLVMAFIAGFLRNAMTPTGAQTDEAEQSDTTA